jgi:hypothetical protein
VNVVPPPPSSAAVFGITDIESSVWSSVISTTMFGLAAAAGANASRIAAAKASV